jgi:hypothetical protein
MNSVKLRHSFVAALASVLFLAIPAHAGKRRAVTPKSPGAQFTVEEISGQVLDNATGQPVRSASFSVGNRRDTTDAEGRFQVKNVTGYGVMTIEVDRSGYKPYSAPFRPNDSPTLTIRLTPTPTVRIRKTNAEILDVDMESLMFGYPVPFSGYRDAESDDFCNVANGSEHYIHRSQMAKLTGPAVMVAAANCCSEGPAAKMTLTLKSGQTMDVVFTDTCEERYQVDIGARVHTTGQFVHVPITDIVEVIFP